jgi:hypothetical protein
MIVKSSGAENGNIVGAAKSPGLGKPLLSRKRLPEGDLRPMPPQDDESGNLDWRKAQMSVLLQLKQHEARIESLRLDLAAAKLSYLKELGDLGTEIAMLKLKAALAGAGASLLISFGVAILVRAL